jgi:hypothetical protein
MVSVINFVVKRIDGTVEPFTASPFSTLIEVVGIEPLDKAHIFKDGQSINKYMTLNHENITDGSVLFVAKNKVQEVNRRKHTRIFSLKSLFDFEIATEELEAKKELETARISDVIWSGWEMSKNHNRMLAMMQNRRRPSNDVSVPADALSLEQAKEIRSDPLPVCFQPDDD